MFYLEEDWDIFFGNHDHALYSSPKSLKYEGTDNRDKPLLTSFSLYAYWYGMVIPSQPEDCLNHCLRYGRTECSAAVVLDWRPSCTWVKTVSFFFWCRWVNSMPSFGDSANSWPFLLCEPRQKLVTEARVDTGFLDVFIFTLMLS